MTTLGGLLLIAGGIAIVGFAFYMHRNVSLRERTIEKQSRVFGRPQGFRRDYLLGTIGVGFLGLMLITFGVLKLLGGF